jgi:adenylate cyclase
MAGLAHERRGVPMAWIVVLVLVAAALPLAGLLLAAEQTSRQVLADVTARIGAASAAAAAARVDARLRGAEEAILDVEAAARSGLVRPDDADSVAAALRAVLLRRPDLAESAFTAGRIERDDESGAAVLATGGRWQAAAERARDGAVSERRTTQRGDAFVSVAPGAAGESLAPDPTAHPTFTTPASAEWRGRIVWSDLHRTQLDAALPEDRRRVVVAAQRSIEDADGRFAGVLRVSLAAGDLGGLLAQSLGDGARGLTLLSDGAGRLIASAGAANPLVETEDGLRADPRAIGADVAAALAAARAGGDAARVEIGGRNWVAAVHPLSGTQDWRVVVCLPDDAFAEGLEDARRTALYVAGATALGVIGAAAWTLRAALRTLRGIAADANRLRQLDFAATPRAAAVREVRDVLDGLEGAKSALRALGRFVPVDLVRGLVAAHEDPRPGGEVRDVTVLFSDIEGFTTLAESMPPDAVAALTSESLASATAAVHASGGIVDKFIGDSVMALWNAPSHVLDHAARACSAAVAARDAERRLVESPAWSGRPKIRTRFGVHTGRAVVGNIGSPERLNYTAVGDTVNLASRLEGLNKVYGTSIIVSEAVRELAGARFDFRLVDRVAVKGRAGSVRVFELLGGPGARSQVHDRYEEALAAYARREFAAAGESFAALEGDGPARALRARCARYAAAPPPPDWDGSFTADSK